MWFGLLKQRSGSDQEVVFGWQWLCWPIFPSTSFPSPVIPVILLGGDATVQRNYADWHDRGVACREHSCSLSSVLDFYSVFGIRGQAATPSLAAPPISLLPGCPGVPFQMLHFLSPLYNYTQLLCSWLTAARQVWFISLLSLMYSITRTMTIREQESSI